MLLKGMQKAVLLISGLISLLSCNSQIDFDIAKKIDFSSVGITTIGDATMTEGASRTVSVSLSSAATEDISLDWKIVGFNPASNFVTSTGTILVLEGQSSVNVDIQSVDDAIYEGTQSYELVVSNKTESKSSTFSLGDNEIAPQFHFTTSSATVAESVGGHTLNSTLDHSVAYPVIVEFSKSGTAFSSDHGLSSNTFTIPAGVTSYNWSIPIVNDFETEGSEVLNIDVVSVSANGLNIPIDVANKDFALTISANDSAPSAPTTFNLSNAGSAAGSTNERTVDISLSGGSAPTKICISETQMVKPISSNATCVGGSGADNGWHTSIPSEIDISSGEGTKTVYVWIADSDGVVSLTPITDTIELDETSPIIAVTSPAAGSAVNAGNFNNFVVSGTCSDDITTVNYTATGGDGGSTVCSSGTYSFSLDYTAAANGTVSVDITHVDEAGNSNTESRSFNKSVVMTDPAISIKDQTSNNSLYTNSTIVNLEIVNDGTVAKWCVSETQTTLPANTATCSGSAWVLTKPTGWTFSAGEGSRTLYIWVATAGDVINTNSGSDSITLDTIVPTTSDTSVTHTAILANYSAFTIKGNCSENGQAVKLSGDIVKNLACSGGTWSTTENLSSFLNGTINLAANHSDAAENSATALPIVITKTVYSTNPTSLSLADSSANPGFAKSTSLDTVTIVDDVSAVKWCLSEGQTVRPINTSVCVGGAWVSSEPSSFSLSSGDGLKTIYLWTADVSNVISQNSVSTTITLDESSPTVAVINPSSGDDVVYANYKTYPINGTCSDDTRTVTVSNGADTKNPTCTGGAFSTTLDFTTHIGSSSVNITFDHSDATGNVAVQKTVSVDLNLDIGTPTLSISDSAPANSGYALDQNVNITIGGDGNATKWCVSESQSLAPTTTIVGSCGGTNWVTVEPTNFVLSAGESTKTVFVWIADNDDNISRTAVSETIELDETLPTVSIVNPSAATPIDLSNHHSFNISGTCSEIGSNVTISNSASATTSCNFGGTWTHTFDLSAIADGTITFDIDHSDIAGNSATQGTRSYTKSVSITEPSIALDDQSSGSTVVSNSLTIDVVIGTDSQASKWCLSQTQNTKPANTSTCAGSSWVTNRPTTWTFSAGEGSRDLYLWVAGNGDFINTGVISSSIIIDTVPSTLAFTTAANSAVMDNSTIAGTCSEDGTVNISGDVVSKNVTCTGGVWSDTLDFSAQALGNVTVNIDQTDNAGNISTQVSRVFNKVNLIHSLSADTINSFSVDVSYAVTSTTDLKTYKWAIAEGSTAPGSCSNDFSNTNLTQNISGLKGATQYSLIVCFVNNSDIEVESTTTTFTTLAPASSGTALVCSGGGTVATTCNVNDSQAFADSSVIYIPGNLVLQSGGSITSNAIESLSLHVDGNVTIESGGSIAANIKDLVTSTLDIQTGGKIDVSGLGYAGGKTSAANGLGSSPGLGHSGTSADPGGAGHASAGGNGRSSGGSTIYGDKTAPVDYGSGGGAGDDQDGGDGGGIAKISVDTLIVNGDLLAKGINGVSTSSDQGAGGSGGSIWLNIENSFSGTGTISAQGGDAGWGTNAGGAGSGSGGRIAIYQTNNTYGFNGILSVDGGRRSVWAGNGSLYVSLSSMDQLCDAGTLSTTCTVSTSKYFGDSTTISGTGNIVIDGTGKLISTGVNSSLNFNLTGNLTLQNGGEIRTDYKKSIDSIVANTVTIAGTINGNITNTTITNFDLQATGVIDASEFGHWGEKGDFTSGGEGPSGGTGHSTSSADPGGGGHAAVGGNGRVSGGTTIYGSRSAPITWGSGGGAGDEQDGGNGGGAIKISATNITLNGLVKANGGTGEDGGSDHGAGGAGGSIWIIGTNSITGTGSLEAKGGGAPVHDNQVPGAGSGGRISINQTSNTYTFAGSVDVDSADIGSKGGVGTFYLGLTNNDQLCDSGNFSTTCIVSTTKIFGGDINITTGNLTINATGSLVGKGSDSTFIFNSTGDFDVLSGGSFSMVAGTSVTNIVAANFNMAGTWNANIADSTIDDSIISGTLNVNELGFRGGSACQNGFGDSPGLGTCNDGGGGAHATNGGNGDASTAGSPAYGSNTAPITWGSGGGAGGAQIGGFGGGAIKLNVNNTLNITGTISANGGNGSVVGDISGGGAGGSIWLAANDIIGAGGSVSANGSQSGHTNSNGDGAAGRISVEAVNYSASVSYDYSSDVSGGSFYTNITNYLLSCSGGGTVLTTCFVNDSQTVLAGMTVTIPGNLVIQSGGDVTTQRLESGTLNITGNLTIESGGKLSMNLANLIASTLDIQAGGSIDVTGKGYLGGKVNGASGQGPSPGIGDSNSSGAGAGHAGVGANGVWSTTRLGGQTIYGSKTNPVDYGSGGGAGDELDAGDGGGIAKITVTNLIVNGDILANGSNGAFSGCCDHAGGGSGGSLWITASNSITGSGTISVKGGDSYGSGGAGSGGRLAIYQTANTYSFTGTIVADRGVNGSIAGEGSYYLGLTSIDQLCDSGNFSTTCTISTKKTFGDALSITSGNLVISPTGSLVGEGLGTSLAISTTGNIEIQNGGSLEMENTKEITITNVNNFTIAGTVKANIKSATVTNFDLQATGSINVSSLGHLAGTQENESGQGLSPGGGDNNDSAGGGGHASLGGDDSFGGGENLGGPITYGINSAPVEYGSGGGSGEFFDGGSGGGIVKIIAGNLALNGSILTNGGTAQAGGGCCDHGGGGSAGSVWLTASTSFSGTGNIQSNGGNSAGIYGGSGSGGRIALISSSGSYTFNGSVQTIGGTVGNVSGPGSLYLNVANPDSFCTTGNSSTVCTMSDPLFVKDINVTGDLVIDSPQSLLGGASITVGGDFTLKNGRTIASITNDAMSFAVSGDTTIETGATINANISDFTSNNMNLAGVIDASELGSGSYTGTGRGGLGSGGGNPASGAGYGSAGGRGYDNNPGVTYGDQTAPTDLGSGGGYDDNVSTRGGKGGGAVKLSITDTLTFTGSIKSNGGNPVSNDSGGGSGGSIWINTGGITGAGTLEAKGGNTEVGGHLNGAGGSGRIAIYATDIAKAYDYSGTVNLLNEFDSGIEEGSFYVNLATNNMICDTGDFSTTCVVNSDLTLGGTHSFTGAGSFSLDSTANLKIHGASSSINFDLTGNFSTAAGTTIDSYNEISKIHSAGTINIAGAINAGLPDVYAVGDITVNGTLSALGKGFRGGTYHHDGQGTEPGLRNAGGVNPAGAGGHGGAGGSGYSAGTGGGVYGSSTQPNTKGSGGASDEESNGGAGGGVIKIVSDANISINALIDSNGVAGEASGGGGGAGGSIFIDANSTCSGASNIEAKGGNAGTTFYGAGGGGGRIHLSCGTNSWTGALDVSGGSATGTGAKPGSAGTTDTTLVP